MAKVNLGKLRGGGASVNLLDNADFRNPINQRGRSEYLAMATNAYAIDRWAVHGVYVGGLYVKDDCIRIDSTNDSANVSFYQPVDFDPTGMTLTFSILTKGGRLATLTVPDFKVKRGYQYAMAGLSASDDDGRGYITLFTPGSGHLLRTYICSSAGDYLDVVAAKLEVGDHQTLAEKLDDGTWRLLDAPPNRELELAKCQRYYQVRSSVLASGFYAGGKSFYGFLDIPPMRANPSIGITVGSEARIRTISGRKNLHLERVNLAEFVPNSNFVGFYLYVSDEVEEDLTGKPVVINSGCNLTLDANL